MRSETFQDFDAFSQTVRDVDSVMMMQNPRRRLWTISHVNLAGIHIQLGSEGSGNITEGCSRSDGHILFVPLNNAGYHAVNGVALDHDSIGILEPGCDFCVRCKIEHDWCSIFVPRDQVPYDDSARMICRVSQLDRQAADRLRTLVGKVIRTACECSQFESSAAASAAAAELREVVLLIVGRRPPAGHLPKGRPSVPRAEVIRRAKEILAQLEGQHVRVGELAAAADVCERTLRTAFREYFGVGPTRYLQTKQLHQIHRALRAADPEAVSTAEVMTQNGVWELGRCARRYHQLFGKRPSDTLRAKHH